jgi:hypothetical protein
MDESSCWDRHSVPCCTREIAKRTNGWQRSSILRLGEEALHDLRESLWLLEKRQMPAVGHDLRV